MAVIPTFPRRYLRAEWMLEAACAVAYGASLLLPAFGILKTEVDVYPGWLLLIWGSSALLQVGSSESLFFSLAWLANVAFAVAHVSLTQRKAHRAGVFAAAAVVLSACFAFVKETTVGGMCTHHSIEVYGGYLLWLTSMLLTLASSCVTLRRVDGPSAFKIHWRAILGMTLLALAYVALGLLLPPGKCSLLR